MADDGTADAVDLGGRHGEPEPGGEREAKQGAGDLQVDDQRAAGEERVGAAGDAPLAVADLGRQRGVAGAPVASQRGQQGLILGQELRVGTGPAWRFGERGGLGGVEGVIEGVPLGVASAREAVQHLGGVDVEDLPRAR
jgi:hypothetical protein